MNLKQMQERMAAIEIRRAAIMQEVDTEGADVEKLNAEVRSLNEERAKLQREIDAAVALQQEARSAVAGGAGVEVRGFVPSMGTPEQPKVEVRNSPKYIEAYAEYLKSGDDTEVRSFLTENVSGGTIAVPDMVLDIVKVAWEKNDIMRLVNKVQIPGNLKVNFEISGTEAVVHTEGGAAVTEETLVEGIATLIPAMRKKWKSLSKEAYKLRGEAFLQYLYNEIAYKITKKIADDLIALIAALPATATSTSPSADVVTMAPDVDTVAYAFAHLSDQAGNPVVVINKLTHAAFRAAAKAANYGMDPFDGLTVHYTSALPAYSAADAGDVYMIVGDFGEGALANFPDGEGVDFTFDPYSRKKEDLIEVLGEEYVALGVVADKAFTLVKKPTT